MTGKLKRRLGAALRFTLLVAIYTLALVFIVTGIRLSDNVPAGETAIKFQYEVF